MNIVLDHNYVCAFAPLNINILGLNVCGIRKKHAYGILNNIVNAFDIVCLSETITDIIYTSLFPNFNITCLKSKSQDQKLGRFHGVSVLVSKNFPCSFTIIHNMTSDCILWLKINFCDHDFILGAVYIPHDCSRYFSQDLFDDISADCITLNQPTVH